MKTEDVLEGLCFMLAGIGLLFLSVGHLSATYASAQVVPSHMSLVPPMPEEERVDDIRMFVDQLRVSFEGDIFHAPLTEGQWSNFRYALAFLASTATDEQWAAIRNSFGQEIDPFSWDIVRGVILGESRRYLDAVERECNE